MVMSSDLPMPCYTSTVVDIADSEVVLDLIRIDDAVFIAEETIGWRPSLDDWSRAISRRREVSRAASLSRLRSIAPVHRRSSIGLSGARGYPWRPCIGISPTKSSQPGVVELTSFIATLQI